MKKKRNHFIFVVFLYLLLPLIAFWRNFDFSGLNLSFFHVDFIGYYFPDYLQGIEVVRSLLKSKPFSDILWDPYNLLGYPLVGAIDRIGLFYPVRMVFYLISTLFSLKYQVFLATYYSLFHMSLAGIFTYIFIKRFLKIGDFGAFVAGLIYSLGGAMVFLGIFTNVINSATFLPLILYFLFSAVENKSYKHAIFAAFSYTPILVAGYTQTFLYNNIFIFLFLLFYYFKNKSSLINICKYFVLANFMAILLSSVMIIPSFEIKQYALRQELNLIGSAGHSFTIESLVNYLIPHLYGIDKNGTVFGYISVVGIMLVLTAFRYSSNRLIAFFTFSGLLVFILSLGNVTFLHSFFYKFVPFYNQFRFLTFFHYILGFSLACIAGIGADILEIKKINRLSYYKLLKNIFLISALIWLGLFIFKPFFNFTNIDEQTFNEIKSSTFLFLLYITSIFLIFKFLYLSKSKYFKAGLIIIILLDLFTLISKTTFVNSDYDPRKFISAPKIISQYKDDLNKTRSRIYLGDSTLRFNSALSGIQQIEGFHGLTLLHYNLLINHYLSSNPIDYDSPLFDILAVKYIVTSQKIEKKSSNLELVNNEVLNEGDAPRFMSRNGTRFTPGANVYVYRNKDVLLRAFFVEKVITATTDNKALSKLKKINLRKEAVVTVENTPHIFLKPGSTESKIEEYRNSYIKLKTYTQNKSFLVLSDIYFPGWEAYVDGKKTKVFKTNIALRGIEVPKGTHKIEFKYNPKSFYNGLYLTTISFIVCMILILKPSKIRKSKHAKNN